MLNNKFDNQYAFIYYNVGRTWNFTCGANLCRVDAEQIDIYNIKVPIYHLAIDDRLVLDSLVIATLLLSVLC